MIKLLPYVISVLGLIYFACSAWEDEPEYLPSLAYSKWKVDGVGPSSDGEKTPSKTNYQLEFINDSTFTLNLDINKVIGRYSATPYGELSFYKIMKNKDCCDSQYALKLEEILKSAHRYRISEGGITLMGNGEIYLKNQQQ
ncbi:META domain-containing protein [Pleomorphovibrio marinus]|uniref:META domain-containing protein n=1 Tax=Pleomorphovibrio marinus TaxID=2164132 RepID=UPI000E0BBCE1|nr:META domain-containing protein [Pleomorphovibrio marinus]